MRSLTEWGVSKMLKIKIVGRILFLLSFYYRKLNFNSLRSKNIYIEHDRGIAAYNYAIMEKIDLNTIITEAIYSARTKR